MFPEADMTKAELCGTEAAVLVTAAVAVILASEEMSVSLQIVHLDRHQKKEVSAIR